MMAWRRFEHAGRDRGVAQPGARRIVVAVGRAESTCRELAALADEVVCATTPSPFFAVGTPAEFHPDDR
jgi:predicted phosphoribosyltransferase